MKRNKIKTLIKLLDDEDLQTSGQAMSELISRYRNLGKIVKSIQESNDKSMRKKAHQLQVVVKNREIRKNLTSRLIEKKPDLIKGLVELHLQWFDEDNESTVLDAWKKFYNLTEEWKADTIEDLSEMMKNIGMEIGEFDEFRSDDYCIGEIVSAKTGADFLLCGIARILARNAGWEPSIIATDTGFCIYDDNKNVGSFPTKKWTCVEYNIRQNVKRWSDAMLLKLAANSMFFCAIVHGNIRYSYMIGSCLSESIGTKDVFSVLPYPMGDGCLVSGNI